MVRRLHRHRSSLIRRGLVSVAMVSAVACGFEGQGGAGADDDRDHDGDGVSDLRDGCPHIPTAEQRDQDRDGVGDECDPDGTMHQRILFDGFYEAPSPERWEVVGVGSLANWVQTSRGEASFLSQASLAGGRRQLRLKLPVSEAIVETRVLVDTLVDTSELRAVGLVVGDLSAQVSSSYGVCAARRTASATDADDVASGFYSGDTSQIEGRTGWSAKISSGALRLRGQLGSGARLDCLVTHSEGPVASAAATRVGGQADGQVGLHTVNAGALFDYLFIIAPRAPR